MIDFEYILRQALEVVEDNGALSPLLSNFYILIAEGKIYNRPRMELEVSVYLPNITIRHASSFERASDLP